MTMPRRLAAAVSALALVAGLAVATPAFGAPATATTTAAQTTAAQTAAEQAGAEAAAVPAPAAPQRSWWSAGNIISDYNFFNGAAMTAGEIQGFLDSHLSGTCRTGYTCLKDHRWNIPYLDERGSQGQQYCQPVQPKDNATSAEVIEAIGRACNVSQKTILVTLEKEMSLVTDNWPTEHGSYKHAMGFACPDTAPCDDAYSGFVYQVYWGVKQFQIYRQRPELFNYRVGQQANIAFNPNAACGTWPVFIENSATAALYNYTPYTPNGQALDAGYGYGDGCSSYGNRNFWILYWDWFGDPRGGDPALVQALYTDVLGRAGTFDELSWWNNALQRGSQPSQISDGFLTAAEYRANRITQAYQDVLGRDPEPGGVDWWLQTTAPGGLPIDVVQIGFMTSDEFYRIAGGTDEAFVTDLYRRLLGRDPEPAGLTYWVAKTQAEGRGALPLSIYNSDESSKARIDGMYQLLLGRSAAPSEQAGWLPIIQRDGTNAVRISIAASPEYRNRAQERFPDEARGAIS